MELGDPQAMTAGRIGTWHGLVIDCSDPQRLATFYERLLGYIRVQDEESWVVIGVAPDQPGLAFQKVEPYTRQEWPRDHAHQHIDVRVDDLPSASDACVALGASVLDRQATFWVHADPEGHPFCLVSF